MTTKYLLHWTGTRVLAEEMDSGSVPHAHVTNFPAFPASQAVTVVALPLPAGATTNATLLTVKAALDAILAKLPAKSVVATRTTKAVTAVSSTVLVANAARLGASLVNLTGTSYVGLGTTAASDTDYTAKLGAGDVYMLPVGYTGPVQFVRGNGTGSVVVTELL